MEKSYQPLKPILPGRQSWDNKVKGWKARHDGHPKILGIMSTEGNEALAANPELWEKLPTAKDIPASFTLYTNTTEMEYSKPT